MKTKLFFTGLAFFAITSLGLSQNGQPQDKPARNQDNCPAWVDENKDGVCDNFANRTPGQGRVSNANGFCGGRNQGQKGQGMMNGQGKGRNFIDADKNGICDRFEATRNEPDPKK